MTRYLKALCALLALWTGAAWGQDYPSKPIVLVVPFAPGGSSDFLSRMIGQKLTEAWKQQVVIENKPGGAGNIALAKAKPGTINYGSAGNGSAGHLAMEYLKQTAQIDLVHVPYKGTGPMLTDLLGGSTQATFTGATPLVPHIKQGKLRALAVGSAKRIPSLPDIPTVAESGFPSFETSQWYGIMAPAGTPDAIVAKLSGEINRILQTPDVIERLAAEGSVPAGNTPVEFARFIDAEQRRWGAVVKSAAIKPE